MSAVPGKFTWNRSSLSYTKVHILVNDKLRLASVWRNRKLFVNARRLARFEYLNVGPGYNVCDDFVNLDYRW